MSTTSQKKSQISGHTGLSTSSMASSMNSRGLDIQQAVLMPISRLLLLNMPKYFSSNFITQLSFLLEAYMILFYFGLNHASVLCTL